MLVTQRNFPIVPDPIHAPVSPLKTERPLTVQFQDAPFVESRRQASISELRAFAECIIPTTYPEHTELPFHGKGHPYQVAQDSMIFIKRIEDEGKSVNRDALYISSLLHDIFYKASYQTLGFSSREHLAGQRSYEMLRMAGATEEFARAVERTIYATDYRTTAVTLEEKVMKAADLFNVADLFATFKSNAQLLCDEQQLLSGTSVTFQEFTKGAINYLGLYAFREIDASRWARLENGASEWHIGFTRNAARLFLEQCNGSSRLNVCQANNRPIEQLVELVNDQDTMYVIEAEGEELREQILNGINAHKRSHRIQSPVLVVPPTGGLSVESVR